MATKSVNDVINHIIDNSKECTYVDIANILFNIYGCEFMYDTVSQKWFKHIQGKWVESYDGTNLRVCGLFLRKRIDNYNQLMSMTPDDKEYVKLKQRQRTLDAVIIDLKKNNLHTVKPPKYIKKAISATLKRLVWNHHIGELIGKTKCLCCRVTDITQLSFHCGHVVAESNGGDTTLSNLRPICQNCNSSMGTKNMNDFMKSFH
jgi:hypothetical protein